MRLQKDFDHTEHYVFKHELRTIEVNVENLDIIHLFIVLEINCRRIFSCLQILQKRYL